MPTLLFTQSARLQEIAQDYLPTMILDDPLFRFMPIDSTDVDTLIWEQEDNYAGLLMPRALDAGFSKINRTGMNVYQVQPMSFGGQKTLNEKLLTVQRQPGTMGDAVNIEDLQQRDLVHLMNVTLNRIRLTAWTLFTTGAFTVADDLGTTIFQDAFNLKTFTALNSWANPATSTPLADLRAMQILSRGSSVRFDSTSTLFINRTTANALFANTNNADIGGRRVITATGINPLNLDIINTVLLGEGLPQIAVYDEGYYASAGGSFNLFIPDYKGVLIGRRTDGGEVAKWWMTRNPNNMVADNPRNLGLDGAAELYVDFEWKKNPIRGITTVGMNGAPAIYFPSAIVAVTL